MAQRISPLEALEVVVSPIGKAHAAPYRAYRVTGDCMVPEIEPGDVIVIEPGVTPQDGEIVAVTLVETHQFLVKRLYHRADGGVDLVPNEGDMITLKRTSELIVDGVVRQIVRTPRRRRRMLV